MVPEKQNSHKKIDLKKAKLTCKKKLEAKSHKKAKLTSVRRKILTFRISQNHTGFSRKLIATLLYTLKKVEKPRPRKLKTSFTFLASS